jgi:hypothetical protein
MSIRLHDPADELGALAAGAVAEARATLRDAAAVLAEQLLLSPDLDPTPDAFDAVARFAGIAAELARAIAGKAFRHKGHSARAERLVVAFLEGDAPLTLHTAMTLLAGSLYQPSAPVKDAVERIIEDTAKPAERSASGS